MKKYVDPEMSIEDFGSEIMCNGFGFESVPGAGQQGFIDEEEM